VAVAELLEFGLALLPVDGGFLLLGNAASITHAVLVEVDGGLLAFVRVLELNRRIRALVRNHTFGAKSNVLREAVFGGSVVAIWREQ
jgi:hypothetical protein